jgi:hypothetical protein
MNHRLYILHHYYFQIEPSHHILSVSLLLVPLHLHIFDAVPGLLKYTHSQYRLVDLNGNPRGRVYYRNDLLLINKPEDKNVLAALGKEIDARA